MADDVRIAYPVRIERDADNPDVGNVHLPDFGSVADDTVAWGEPEAMLKACAPILGMAYHVALMDGAPPVPSKLTRRVRTVMRVVDMCTCNYTLFCKHALREVVLW